MMIRPATASDHGPLWEIFSAVIGTGDTYVYDPLTPESEWKKHWLSPDMETYVLEQNGAVLGSYIIKPNHIGLGDHIGNCAYMVHPKAQGKGIGRQLCEHSLRRGK